LIFRIMMHRQRRSFRSTGRNRSCAVPVQD
jgi:hypothetical protein